MKPLNIDFSAPSIERTLHRTGAATWVLAAVTLLLCVSAGVLGVDLTARRRAYDRAMEEARLSAAAPVKAKVETALPPIGEPQAAAVNAAVMQLNLPWRALHDAIGAATPSDIAMLALEPDARKRSIKITAEAKSSDAMIGYVEELKKQEMFVGVLLARHEINEQDPLHPIRFQIEAQWTAP